MKPNGTYTDRKVLVTGAGGFIGSHLVEGLLREGAHVRALVRYTSRGTRGWLESLSQDTRSQIDFRFGDLRDYPAVRDAVADREVVFHLGAMISIPYSYQCPWEAQAINVQGTLHVLEASKEARVGRIVHTSTSEVYGTARTVPIDEAHPLQGQSPYSASKIGADKLAESFYNAYELPVVTIRPFNTYGPRQSARAVIPTILTQALSTGRVRLGSLTPTRDFTYVLDTVRGMLLAGLAPHVEGKTINLGSGSEVSIGELAERLIRLVREVDPCRPVELVSDEGRVRPEKSEVNRLLSDNRLAQSLLGWRPETSLDQGLKLTLDWFRENLSATARAVSEYVI